MSQERLMMEGKLAEHVRRQKNLRLKADGLVQAIRLAINPTLAKVEEMEIAGAALQMDELVMAQAELLTIGSEIEKLEKALHG